MQAPPHQHERIPEAAFPKQIVGYPRRRLLPKTIHTKNRLIAETVALNPRALLDPAILHFRAFRSRAKDHQPIAMLPRKPGRRLCTDWAKPLSSA